MSAEILPLQLSYFLLSIPLPLSMALAKERVAQDTNMGTMCGNHASDPSFETYGFESYHKMLLEGGGEVSQKGCNLMTSLNSLHEANGNDFMFTSFNTSSGTEEVHSLVDFKTRSDQWVYTNGSLLSFEQGDRIPHATGYSKIGHEDEYMSWVDAIDHKIEGDYIKSKCAVTSCLSENSNSYEKSVEKDNRYGDERYGWLFPAGDSLHDSGSSQGCFNKRPHMVKFLLLSQVLFYHYYSLHVLSCSCKLAPTLSERLVKVRKITYNT